MTNKMEEAQPDFWAYHPKPPHHKRDGSMYTRNQLTTAITAARVQENERCVQALEALWHSNDDSTKKCIDAIRTLIGAKHD